MKHPAQHFACKIEQKSGLLKLFFTGNPLSGSWQTVNTGFSIRVLGIHQDLHLTTPSDPEISNRDCNRVFIGAVMD